jgi:hypothetical protein
MKSNPRLLVCLLLVLASATCARAQVTLKAGDATGAPGSEVEVPILISGSKKAGPIQFILDYDRRILEAIADPPGVDPRGVVFGKVVSGGMLSTNTAEPGELKIALRTDEPITQDGELVRARFLVKGKRGDTCTLNILVPEVWEKESLFEMSVSTAPGTFTVGGFPTLLLIAIGAGILLLLLILLKRKKKAAPAPATLGPATATPATATPATAPASPQPAPASSGDDPLALLKKLKEMQDAGLISPEEFEAKKKELLSRL